MSDKVGLVESSTNSCSYFPVKKLKYFLMFLLGFVLFILYRPPQIFNNTDNLLQDFLQENKTINILFWTTSLMLIVKFKEIRIII